MQITLKQLDAIKSSIARLLTAPGVPVRAAYRAAKFSKAIQKEIIELEEMRNDLVKKYGKETEEGLRVEPKYEETFQKEYDIMLDEMVTFPDIKICVDDLASAGLSMLDIANLDFMLVEVDPTETIH
jgi:hypothetical protein